MKAINEKNPARPVALTQYVQSTPLFTLEQLRQRYGGRCSDRSILNIVYRLHRQGRVHNLARGVYAGAMAAEPLNRYAVPAKLREDARVAFHSALEFHGVVNQVFQTVYYLSESRRKDLVFEGVTYHCVAPPGRLARAGRVDYQVESGPEGVRVTGRERSLVDCLAFLQYGGGAEELDRCLGMFPSFDFEPALEYLRILRKPWLYARLGYLLDRHAERLHFVGKWRDLLLRRLPRGVAYLEYKQPGCHWASTWNLMVPASFAGADASRAAP